MSKPRNQQPKTREEIATERHRIKMKHFDLAEAPVKAWIAAYLNERTETIFSDWQEEYEILNIESNGKFYILYWSPVDAPTGSLRWDITVEDFKKAPIVQQAGRMMLEAIRTVYGSIVEVMEQRKSEIADNNVVPFFEESTMSYKFGRINQRRRTKQQHERDAFQCVELLKKIDDQLAKPFPSNLGAQQLTDERDRREALQTEKKKLIEIQQQNIAEHNAISEADCGAEQVVCDEWNARFESQPRLYLFIKEAANVPMEQRIARADMFSVHGAKYIDTDDD